MTGKAKKKALALDSYGTRIWRSRKVNKSDSVYGKCWVANLATLLFVTIDFVCLYTVWNTVQTESAVMIALLAVGCAVCLDVPMAIAGYSLKSMHKKIKDKNSTLIVLILAITTFILTFAFAFWFRIETKDLTFEVYDPSTLLNSLSEGTTEIQTENNAVLVAGMFNAVVPLCTSIASFVISYFASNPLQSKISKLDEAIITIDSNIAEIEQACEEAKRIDDYKSFLIVREEDMYRQFCESSEAQGLVRKQAVRFVIMEMLGTPDDISVLTESGERVNRSVADNFNSGSSSTMFLKKEETQ